MKLLTHNFLSSRFLKGTCAGYPLKVHCTKKEAAECEMDEDMLIQTIKKIEYIALRAAAISIGEGGNLPDRLPDGKPEKFPQPLKNELHRVLFCIEIIDGELECPDTGRRFPVKDGIPNMLCNEDECA